MKLPRFARLLPSVIVVGTGLLVLNASGLIHDAYAGSPQADAMAPPPAPGNKDFANDDGQVASASEVEVLTSLSKRRSELDANDHGQFILEKAGKLKRIAFTDRAEMKKLVDPVMAAYAKEIGADKIFAAINDMK